ncbi:hypothetical protein SAMN02745687_00203 [Lachnospiraceae bacterium NK3A20]|nr:hypothetical protein SAMN02745687_00203 [Lachnospiraceae bacterium NK3A20]
MTAIESKQREIKYTNFKMLFLLAFFLPYSFYNSKLDFSAMVSAAFTVIAVMLFLLIIANKKYSIKFLVISCILLIIGLVSYYQKHMSIFLLTLLSAVLIEEEDKKNAVRIFFLDKMISLFILLIFLATGAISNNVRVFYKAGMAVSRYCYGYGHPNQFAQVLCSLLMAIVYLTSSRRRHYLYIFQIASIILIYRITGSRAGFIVCAVLFIVSVLAYNQQLYEGLSNFISKIVWLFFGVILFFSIGLPYFFLRATGKWRTLLYSLNDVMSSRLSFSSAVMQNYDISLFGNAFDFTKLKTIYGDYAVDNSYINLLYRFGIIGIVLFVLLAANTIKVLAKKGDLILSVILMIFCIWAIVENILLNPSVNFCLPLLGIGLHSVFLHQKRNSIRFASPRYKEKRNLI